MYKTFKLLGLHLQVTSSPVTLEDQIKTTFEQDTWHQTKVNHTFLVSFQLSFISAQLSYSATLLNLRGSRSFVKSLSLNLLEPQKNLENKFILKLKYYTLPILSRWLLHWSGLSWLVLWKFSSACLVLCFAEIGVK